MKGLHSWRLKDNPEEGRFSKAWEPFAAHHLKYLLSLGDDMYPPDPSDRDERVAATVIQWLGSPVGQGWLRELGYERKKVTP